MTSAHQAIAAQLKVHSITRKYRAIVHGRLTEDGVVHTTIGRHPQNRKLMAVNVSKWKGCHHALPGTGDI